MRVVGFLSILLVFTIGLFFAPQTFAQACTPLTTAPDLYQIDKTGNQDKLYFSPAPGTVTSYTIIYGLSEGDERYSTTFNYGSSTGAITYTVENLDPKTTYYFKVRANNSCSSSQWSEWVADQKVTTTPTALANTGGGATTTGAPKGGIPATGSETVIAVIAGSALLILSGLFFFSF